MDCMKKKNTKKTSKVTIQKMKHLNSGDGPEVLSEARSCYLQPSDADWDLITTV